MSPDIRRNAFIAWLLIIIQFITPVLTLLPAPVRADVDMSADMQGTIHGLNSLIFGEPAGHHDSPPVVSGEGQTVAPVVPLSAGPQGQRAVPDARLIPEPRVSPGLPDLTRPVLGQGRPLKVPSENMLERHVAERSSEPEGTLASGAMQMGSMFSSENRTDAAINYARGVGEGLINQRVNDWLNQFGNAKVSLGSGGQFSGDMLIPLHDTDQNLIFTQLGVRRGQERNTVNLGAGYRTYMDDWMLGGNVFYDYDYTGKNRRLGGGAELWRDYLKLGVNGYIRLTNWHQSVLSEMEDYDERPANGFDIRAEGYLPAWPYLGGSLKYEQYFGRGVSVSDSTSPDTLKDNPAVLTAGLSYTPFPLMTLSASRSVGDSNDTLMALDINYRLGVPWYQQVSPDNVDLMRSLAGNKYDFVDRNYNIVMQYRKQELLRIGLPERRRAQAMETITIPLTIAKVKYGLKGVDWSVSPELMARGGRYRILTPTEIEVMLPAYIFSGDQKTPQTYQISAMATDNHDNQSNTATMQIDVVPSDNGVTIKSDKNNAKADGQGTDSVLVQVTDKKAGQVVALTADNGAVIAKTVTTDEKGQATASLTSMVAGASTVTATMLNGNYDTTEVHFVADSATAQVKSVLLQGDEVSRVADGSSSFRYAVTVTDANGNPVADQTVTAQADKPDHVTVAADGATNAAGQTTVTLTSTTTAVSDIQVSVRAGSTGRMVDADKKVSFVAGAVSPDKSDFVAAPDHIVADGQAVSTLTLTLRDSNGNAVSGQAATLSAKVAGAGDTQVTGFTEGTAGSYTAGLTGTEAGQATVQAMQGARPASNDKPAVTLTADAGTAQVSALAVTQDGAKADGEDADSVQVQVTDAHDNPVADQAVALTADNGAVIAKTVTTDEKGRATAPLTSKVAGLTTVTATLGDSSQTATAHFVADSATAQVKSVLLQGDEVSRVADGSSSFRYAVTVTDANGNPVADQTVTAQADKPDHVTVAADGATNAAGQTTVTLTSTTTAVSDIQVSVRAGSTGRMVDADKKVSFVAGAVSPDKSDFVAAPDHIVADGQAVSTLTLTLRDGNGNAVSGQAATLSAKVAGAGDTQVTGFTEGTAGRYTAGLTGTEAGQATVQAMQGARPASNDKPAVTLTADAGTAQVSALAVTQDGAKADGEDADSVQVQVTDAHDNPVAGQAVALTADNGAVIAKTVTTDEKGRATAPLTSKVAGLSTVTATLGDSSQTATAHFVADGATAQVKSVLLQGDEVSRVADGSSSFRYAVTVTDANGNPVADQTVTAQADKPDHVTVAADGATNAAGQTTVTLTSTTTAVSDIQVSVRAGSTGRMVDADKKVSFVAGAVSPDKSDFVAAPDHIVADGQAVSTLTLTLRDSNGNAVSGQAATLSAKVAGAGDTQVTGFTEGTAGRYTAGLTGTEAGQATVQAMQGARPASNDKPAVTLTADAGTAQVKSVLLQGDEVSRVADGNSSFHYAVTVTDANGNPVADQTVTAQADKPDHVTVAADGATNAAGQTTVTLTSTTTAVSDIQVSVRAGSTGTMVPADKKVSFVADSATAQVKSVLLQGDEVSRVADGSSSFRYAVTVTDANGNPVADQTVTAQADKPDHVTVAADGATNAAGQTTVTLTSTTTAVSDVQVSVRAGSTGTMVDADKKVSFVAGAVSPDKSDFVAAPDHIVADGQAVSTLTLTLRDGNGNAVSGQAATLSAKVAGAGDTQVTGFTEGTAGSYTAGLTGTEAGQVTVQAMQGARPASNDKPAVTLTADAGTAQVKSVLLQGDEVSRVADGNSSFRYAVTVTDANGNPVADQTVTAQADKPDHVTVAADGATNTAGQTTVTLTSTTTAVSDIQVSVRAGSTGTMVDADKKVSFVADVSIKDIAVNGYIFGKDEGFPTTGFKGAMFTIELKNGNASDFNWKADAPWVTVKDGVVSFNDTGTGSKVTITGTPISGEGKIISWDFTLKNWFINNGTTTGTDMDEASFCGSNFSKVPTIQQLNGSERSDGKRGTLGGLWSEWGNLTAFNGSGFVSTNPITDYTGYWTSQYAAATYIVSLSNGKLGTIIGNFSEFMVCRKSM